MKKVLFALMLLVLVPSVLKAEIKPEVVSCTDYYKPDNVQVLIKPNSVTNVSGTKISFSGTVQNKNTFPITSGKLFVKVQRQGGVNDETFGMEEIGSFMAKEGMVIPAGSSIPIDFSWNIPSYILSGKYQLSTYFIVADKFDAGSVAGVAQFEVVAEQKKDVYFSRAKIKLNDLDYNPQSDNQTIGANDKANILLTLKNDTDEAQRVPVTYELYKGNIQAKENLLKSEQITYILEAKTSNEIPYEVTDTNHAVYSLVAKASYKDNKSEVTVKFGREGKQESKVIFSSLTKYPIEKGIANSFITCAQNADKMVATLYDKDGKAIYFSQYEGGITNQGFLSKFNPNGTYKNLTLETKIYDKSGKELDKSSVLYKCSDFLTDCAESGPVSGMSTKVLLIGLLLIIVLAFVAKKIKRI